MHLMQVVTQEFKDALKRLNPEQRQAVEAIDGPVMVVAGPGTGKTEVLTLRIANILLNTDTKPEQILALTFTDAAAQNMRKRLSKVIGAPAYRVRIQTFHSFCNDILQSYPEYFPHIVGAEPVTEVEATSIIEEIIKTEDISILKPWGEPLLYVKDVAKRIEELKRDGIDPEEFEDLIRSHSTKVPRDKEIKKADLIKEEKKIEKNKELSVIYKKYQQKLREKKLYDWSDMIMEVLNKLKSKSLKLKDESNDLKTILQEEHQYILVDEHQDTNDAQNKILEILMDFHESPNIFVVGDHKQAIFRFQGASVENFMYFKKLYPKALLIELFRNYRSTQNILDSAHSLIPSDTPLKSFSTENIQENKIKIASFKNSILERYWIGEEIKKLASPQPLSEREGQNPPFGGGQGGASIAIIYRSNREAFPLALALSKAGVPFCIESDEDLLGDKYVKKLLIILEALHNLGDDIYMFGLLHIEELGIETLEAFKIIRSAKNKKKEIFELIPSELKEKLEKWAQDSKERDLAEFVEQVFKESGLFDSALKSRDADAFLGIEKIFEEAVRVGSKRGAGLPEFISFIDTLRTHEILVKKPKREAKLGSVRLMTVHRSKGLEFDYVFITNASEKSFGGRSKRDLLPLVFYKSEEKEDTLAEERKLFYVALTRAKKGVYITHGESDEGGREILPSVFISEIKDELKENLDVSELEKKPGIYFEGESKVNKGRAIDKEFVSELFYKEQFSVTALNNYLECPWKYFYRNLLRIPYVQEKYLLYGTAMHSAVEAFLKARLVRKDKDVDKKFLLQEFKRAMENAPLSEKELKEVLERGEKSLSVWFDERQDSWGNSYKLEQALYGVEFEGVKLSGKLDKVDFVGDSEVIVTDYKTGKVKSRNEIEGNTQGSNGNIKRQLVFYKLLLNLYDDGRLNMTKGIIEFLEPNDSSNPSSRKATSGQRIKFEEFEIEEAEVEALKKEMVRVINEITELSFWDKYCDEKDCEYCSYRKLLDA